MKSSISGRTTYITNYSPLPIILLHIQQFRGVSRLPKDHKGFFKDIIKEADLVILLLERKFVKNRRQEGWEFLDLKNGGGHH